MHFAEHAAGDGLVTVFGVFRNLLAAIFEEIALVEKFRSRSIDQMIELLEIARAGIDGRRENLSEKIRVGQALGGGCQRGVEQDE